MKWHRIFNIYLTKTILKNDTLVIDTFLTLYCIKFFCQNIAKQREREASWLIKESGEERKIKFNILTLLCIFLNVRHISLKFLALSWYLFGDWGQSAFSLHIRCHWQRNKHLLISANFPPSAECEHSMISAFSNSLMIFWEDRNTSIDIQVFTTCWGYTETQK